MDTASSQIRVTIIGCERASQLAKRLFVDELGGEVMEARSFGSNRHSFEAKAKVPPSVDASLLGEQVSKYVAAGGFAPPTCLVSLLD